MFYMSANVNAFEKVVSFFGKTMNMPKAYGVFHTVSIIVILSACLVAVFFRKRIDEKFLAYSMLVFGIVMAVFEVYKQIVMSYSPITDTWKYPWYIFPFQFCSTPIYITFIAFMLYKLKKRDQFKALTAFLGTYSLIGAVVVLFVGTNSVFSSIIGVNVQTMLHHGIMLLLAVMILFSGTVYFSLKTAVSAFKVFCVLVTMALVMNSIYGDGTKFDMFYLAPESRFVYPMFNKLFGGNLPHFVYVIGYIVLFTLGMFLILGIGRLITKYHAPKKKSSELS